MNSANNLEIIEDDSAASETSDEVIETPDDVSPNIVDNGVITHPDGKKTVHLDYPIEVTYSNKNTGAKRTEEFKSFTFRRPNASDIEAIEKMRSDFGKARLLFSRLSASSDLLFVRLDAKDMNRINGAIASFLE